MRIPRLLAGPLACVPALAVFAQADSARADGLLARHYHDGDAMAYRMTGLNDSTRYSVLAQAVVRRDGDGNFVEEWTWSDLVVDGKPVAPAPDKDARQVLSLDPDVAPSLPNLAAVDPRLIGPMTDAATFYSDLWLANTKGALSVEGDHFYEPFGTASSWADGVRTVLGETSIDFDVTLTRLDPVENMATVTVRHVPPEAPQVSLPAQWMQARVGKGPNNWVEVRKTADGYTAAVGEETFDAEIDVDLFDGKILSATLENVVEAAERHCADRALGECGAPHPRRIHRHIELRYGAAAR